MSLLRMRCEAAIGGEEMVGAVIGRLVVNDETW